MPKPNRTQLTTTRILEALKTPMSAIELADKIYISHTSSRAYIRRLLGKEVYVHSWVLTNRFYTAIYATGKKPNKEKVLFTKQERYKRSMANLRMNQEKYDKHLAKKRIMCRKIPHDPILMAFFGKN